jgi:hypothetical protein
MSIIKHRAGYILTEQLNKKKQLEALGRNIVKKSRKQKKIEERFVYVGLSIPDAEGVEKYGLKRSSTPFRLRLLYRPRLKSDAGDALRKWI